MRSDSAFSKAFFSTSLSTILILLQPRNDLTYNIPEAPCIRVEIHIDVVGEIIPLYPIGYVFLSFDFVL